MGAGKGVHARHLHLPRIFVERSELQKKKKKSIQGFLSNVAIFAFE
jgi:hypothetical protein